MSPNINFNGSSPIRIKNLRRLLQADLIKNMCDDSLEDYADFMRKKLRKENPAINHYIDELCDELEEEPGHQIYARAALYSLYNLVYEQIKENIVVVEEK